MKNDTEEQAEILDLDSHKVQTHRYEDEYSMRMHQHAEMHHHMQIQQHHHQMQHHQSHSPVHSVNALGRSHTIPQSYDYHSSLSPMGPVDNVASMQDQQSQFMLGQLPLAGVEPPRHPGSPIISSSQPMPNHQMHQSSGGLMPNQNPKPPAMGNQSWKSNEARRPKTYNCTACNKWFTSSGHLKRHYNTTLHKNAVKQSNQPDPANMPISAHHHPGRDTTASGRTGGSGGSTNRTSPELSSSSSPPNLMAGPSGEATRGLLHTPTTTTSSNAHIYNNNNHISSSSNSNEAIPLQALQEQKFLEQQIHQQQQQLHLQHQHHHHQQQAQSSGIVMASELYRNTTGQTGMMVLHSHHQAPPSTSRQHSHHQSMSSPSPHQQQQQQIQQTAQAQHQTQQSHHLQIDSPHQAMSSPISPMQQHPVHMSSPSPVATGPQQQQVPPPPPHHHMNSPSPAMVGHQETSPPPPVSMMGGTTMPHQPYPNALPPHVTTITNISGLLKSITSPLTTIGNDELHHHPHHHQQQQQHDHVLPAFDTFTSHHQQQHHLHHENDHELKQPLPNFTQFGYMIVQHPVTNRQANVGGLSPKEARVPSHIKFEAIDRYDSCENYENYENYRNSPLHYEYLRGNDNDVDMMQVPADSSSAVSSVYAHAQQHQHHGHDHEQQREANNNLLHPTIKEKLNSNIISDSKSFGKKNVRAGKTNKVKIETKEHQVTSTNTSSNYISENGLHKCIECDKVFNKACYLTQHNKSFHSGDKPFKCNQCGKRFPLEYQHAEHLLKHAGEKPYKCEVCPKQFNHKTDLRRHMCLHTGEKPYACDNCGKGFIRKDHMMKHVETHKKKNNLHKIHLRA
ncbi:myb-like protein Q [Phymastichus coffea]|uniref:myb-like protein Q n=1 Tax=Phymastichus coffea TaxID=108790 RepID=UPI00273C0AD9|nr:myb-like protein Q [Phymastichus coffea]